MADHYPESPCGARTPDRYHCTIGLDADPRRPSALPPPHAGPHVARAVNGTTLGSVIATWEEGRPPVYSPDYRGR